MNGYFTEQPFSKQVENGPQKIAVDPATKALLVKQGGPTDPSTGTTYVSMLGSFAIPPFDEVEITPVASGNGEGEIETVEYKKDGAVVSTLTFTYNASDFLTNIAQS